MCALQAFVGPPVVAPLEVEIGPEVLVAFWRLGRALVEGASRDREVFTLGRSIGSTAGVTAMLDAYGDRDDPASFAISKLIYGGDQPMLDAYWQNPEDPAVFNLARQVYSFSADLPARLAGEAAAVGGIIVFDVSGDRARLAGLRLPEVG